MIKRNKTFFDILWLLILMFIFSFIVWFWVEYNQMIKILNPFMTLVHAIYFVLTFFSFFVVRRLNNHILNIGWFLFAFGLLVQFLDILIPVNFLYHGGFFVIPGIIVIVLGLYKIILENKKEHKKIIDSEKKYRTLVENLNVGIYRSTDNKLDTFLQINPAMVKIFGYDSIQDMMGIKISELYLKKEEREKIVNEVAEKGFLKNKEMTLKKKNGERIIVSVTAQANYDESGNFKWMDGILEDITQEKRVEQLKTEFVSVASHQLKTPLTGIKWFTELLMRERVGKLTKKQKDFLEQIYNSNQRMLSLVGDLLDVSHIDMNKKFDIRKEKADILEMLEQAINDNMAIIKNKNIKINNLVKTAKTVEFMFDKQKIRQVFYNLIGNAIKYSKDGGMIDIYCDCDWTGRKMVNFHIHDNGLGIPKKEQNKIFSKFFRADNAIIAQTDGTGLGLYIAKAIVEAHGGKIWFESEEGKGTTFHFSLKKQ